AVRRGAPRLVRRFAGQAASGWPRRRRPRVCQALGLIYLLVDLYHIHRRVIAVELAIALHRPPTGVVEGYAGGAQPVADLVEVVDLDREVAVDDRMQPQVVVPRQRLRRLADVNLAPVVG